MAECRPFYETLLPALGFDRDAKIEGWLQFERSDTAGAAEFFGVTESPNHVANECRIAFWAGSISEVETASSPPFSAPIQIVKSNAVDGDESGLVGRLVCPVGLHVKRERDHHRHYDPPDLYVLRNHARTRCLVFSERRI
jgi:hypothetical protein